MNQPFTQIRSPEGDLPLLVLSPALFANTKSRNFKTPRPNPPKDGSVLGLKGARLASPLLSGEAAGFRV